MQLCLFLKCHSPLKFAASLAVGTCCFLYSNAFAQNYSIGWYKIAGGGGTSSGGNYQLSGTIGQPDAGGPMSGGNYSITGGFWAFLSVVQTPGAPTLYIGLSGKTVTVYWQNVSGWVLQQNNSLTTPSGWTQNNSWSTSNGTNYLNLTSPAGKLFFRLESQ
ncbi:MAG TPA: hypothetical protein VME24_05540 [Alphaproteobacteria bacterium]|nr:hypothetical protein [Alphaproteobacteria bacterium]